MSFASWVIFFCFQVDWPKFDFGLGGAGGRWLGVISREAEKKAVYGIIQRN